MTFWEQPASGTTQRERPGGRVVLLVVVLLLVLLAGGYYAAHAVAGDKVPRGATVSGVDVGGLSRADAVAELERAFADRGSEPIEVTVEGESDERAASVRPDEIGLDVDEEASVDAAGAGESWSPGRIWDFYTGGDDVEAVVDVDEELLDARLAELSEGLGTPPQDGAVKLTRNGVSVTDPVPGEAVDTAAARDAITAAYLGDDDAVELTLEPTEPDIDDGDVREAVEQFANPAMSAPVTLVFGEARVKLTPRQYAGAVSLVPEEGELVPEVDRKALTRLVDSATTEGEPVDATVRLVDGRPKVIPAKPGVTYRPDDVVAGFLEVLTAREGRRQLEVEAEVVAADFTTKEARALRIKEKVSEFTTYYPHADYRNVNIGRAAELVNGTLLKPGDVFSLNEVVGERTVENGFTEGYVISNGILVRDLGGGVSQMATTTFNAMFFAGLEDIEHKPHSFYIDRYPVGREATVAWPSVDLSFRNDTPYGVLIQATVTPSTYSTQGVVTVRMFSTKYWDIESRTSGRYNYRAPVTRTLSTPDCEPFTGYSGFDVDVTRVFRRHGEDEVHHTEKFHTSYTAADSVVCKAPKRDDDAA